MTSRSTAHAALPRRRGPQCRWLDWEGRRGSVDGGLPHVTGAGELPPACERRTQMCRHPLVALVAVVAMNLASRGAAPPSPLPDPQVIARLIQDLGSDNFQTREAATRKLVEIG